jgi:ubiquinone/menaquinone biosynthesis C-methylase UbiE
MLPQLDKPKILDIGCGSGVATLELARLSNGDVIGLDIDRDMLDVLRRNIDEARLSHRVSVVNRSLLDMEFQNESFDIIWAEGSIYAIGFEKGLKEWKRFLKPNGFVMVHDEKGNVDEKIRMISACGYELIGHFEIDVAKWRDEYFVPLEKLLSEDRWKDSDETDVLKAIRDARREIDMFKKEPERNSSVCFVMQKR